MKAKIFTVAAMLLALILGPATLKAQTPVPNGDFELWNTYSNYSNPQQWDSPNAAFMSIPLFGKNVVFKSTDKHGGSYSVKLLTQHIAMPGAPFDSPGFITLGTLNIDLITQSYTVTGGAPINDQPTHLMGWYKFQPVGGDSCVVGIVLYKTTGGVQDTIAGGYFSTKDTINDWTHFSAWIEYDTVMNPDTMNIMALSSAQDPMHPGTALWLDDIYLDYTVGYNESDPGAGIAVYQDRETERLIISCEFPAEQRVTAKLYDMTGKAVSACGPSTVRNGRLVIPYGGVSQGIYILAVQHDGQTYTRKFLLGF
jgi:hypothetical protein